jgi:hypothetical protein
MLAPFLMSDEFVAINYHLEASNSTKKGKQRVQEGAN